MTTIYRTHYRCLDSACGWSGWESDLGERVDREAWKHTRPQVQYETCCPRCFGDFVEGSWCPTCGERPMDPHLDECTECFEKSEQKQTEHVRKIQEAVREFHTYRRDRSNLKSRDRLRSLLGIEACQSCGDTPAKCTCPKVNETEVRHG